MFITYSWEQREFSEIAETNRGLTYSPINIQNAGIRVFRSSNIDGEYFVKGDDAVFVEQSCVNISYVSNGDILITAANGPSILVGNMQLLMICLQNQLFMVVLCCWQSLRIHIS